MNSDDFSQGVLDPVWRIEGPAAISGQLGTSATDGFLELVTPDGDHDAWDQNNAARAMQTVSDTDLQLETRFLTTPTEQYQLQGILIEADAQNWIRLGTYSDGSNLNAFGAITVNGNSSARFNVTIPGGTAPYLQVTRAGDDWTLSYSTDGVNWTVAGSFTHALTVTAAGVYAGNTGQAAGYTAQVDYFENTASPIVDEDGTITPVAVAPDAQDDALAADTDTVLTIDVATDLLGNDTDANGDTLSLDSFGQPSNGTLVDNGDGTLSYTPDPGYSGPDSFTYTVTDGGLTDTAVVSVTVSTPPPGPIAPEAQDDALAADADTVLTIDVATDLLGNDTDANGDTLSLDSFGQPANGTLVDNGDGTLTYTPDPGYSGPDSFTYTVTDGGLTDTAVVSVTVSAPPPASDAVSDDFSQGVLDPVWRIEGPAAISGQLGTTATDGFLELVTPDGDHDAWDQNNAARAMQTVSDADLQLETRFLTTPTEQYQMQGILIEADAQNWIRLGTYSDGSNLNAFGAITVNGNSSARFNVTIPGGTAPYLQVTRAGDDWTLSYSTDGVNWTVAGSFTHALTVTAAGVYAGNTGQAVGYTAQVDYFENTASPIVDEDGTITPVAVAPDAQDDALAADTDTVLTIDVATDLLGNDTDANGDTLSLDSFGQPANGTLVDNGDGTLTYTPDPGYSGPDSFTYTVTDGGLTDTAVVSVTVSTPPPGPIAPVAQDDALAADTDTVLTIDVATDLLGNDTDANGDTLSLDSFGQPANGTLVDNGDGTLTYTPDPGYSGPDSFTYTVTDGGLTDTAVVSVTVSAPPASSDAVSDDFSQGVLDPVWRIEGPAAISGQLGTTATDGFLELVTPDGDFNIWDQNNGARAMQTVSDADLQLETRFLTTPTEQYQMQGILIEQDAQNWVRLGTYSDGSNLNAFGAFTVNGNSSAQFNVTIPGGTAPYLQVTRAGDDWTLSYSTDGVNWTVAGSFTHALTVTAAGVYAGNTGQAAGYTAQVDYFENTASPIVDEDGTITPVAVAPDAQDDALAADTDTVLTIDVATDLLGNDTDANGDTLSLDSFGQPSNGTLVDNGDGTLSYTPDPGYSGPDSFTYTVTDGGLTDTAVVSVTVSTPPPGPIAPEAQDDALAADTDTVLTIDVATDLLGNDTDANGDTLSLDSFGQPSNGTLVDNGDGTLTYTPDPGYSGPDSFTYTVTDGGLTDTAVVSVTVSAPPPASDAVSDDFSQGVLDPVWRIEGPAATSAQLGTTATEAFLELVTPDGDFNIWDQNNGARAMQTVSDGDLQLETRFLTTPTERYQMQGILIEQDAQNWVRLGTYSDGSNLNAFGAITVNGNSSGEFNVTIPGGTAPYLQVTRAGDDWTLSYSTDGVNWTVAGSFTHALTVTAAGVYAGNTDQAAGYTAQVDYFENTASPIVDEDGTIVPVAVAPNAQDDALATDADMALNIDVATDLLGNDTDANGDTLSLDSFGQPSNGTLVDNGDGTLSYTPNAGYNGLDSFTYTVTDGGLTDTAVVTVSVGNPINVWYGTEQTFGAPGVSQEWVNILGNVSGDVASLSYTLNGGASRSLSIGADDRRLQNSGDFNVDISFSELDGSSADDTVRITAILATGEVYTQDVLIDYEAGSTWAADYSIDWNTVTDIQDVGQVVDGLWHIENGGVRTTEIGYDRIITLGDSSWDNYQVDLTMTINQITAGTVRDGSGFGFGMLWGGHTDDPIAGQPLAGYNPIVSPFYNTKQNEFQLHGHPNWTERLDYGDTMFFEEGESYNVTVRVEQTNILDRVYSFKIWEIGTAEPTEWTVQGTDIMTEPVNGSFALIAHHWDITFGNIDVTEIHGQDIVLGDSGNEVIAAVDTGQANPGENEIDVLSGGDGSDTFVFGDANGSYYDDGVAASSGEDDYAFVWDFDETTDSLQLHGSAAEYQLTENHAGLPAGTAIWIDGQGGDADELVAVLNGVTGLTLEDSVFVFTDVFA